MYKTLHAERTNYYIYDSGHIWSTRPKRFLKMNDKQGYKSVFLDLSGKRKSYRVSRLVAQAFIPNPDNLPEVNHINHIREDNRVDNLEWCTREYNIKDNMRFGTHAALRTRKLTPQIIKEVKRLYKDTHNLTLISERIGVNRDILYDWKAGRSYKEIPWEE
jgi:HNH endonuclease